MALTGLPHRLQRALRSAIAPAQEPGLEPSDDGKAGARREVSPEKLAERQALLDGTRLSLAEIHAALGKDFLTDRMLDGLAAKRGDPVAMLRRARTEFAQAVRARSFGPALGKWVLYPHPEGFSVWLKLGDSVSTAILRGGYDETVTDIVRLLLKPGGTFLDIGANVGWYTLVAASFYAREVGRVLAFEPQAELFEHLAKSVAQNGFESVAALHPFALGDRDGPIQMLNAGLNSGGSSVVTGERRDSFEDARMGRLDDLRLGPERVDAIKLDIEGAEPLFFQGARAFFATNRPPIVSEVAVRKLRLVAGSSGTEYVRSVLDLGYEVAMIRPEGGLAPFDWSKAQDERLSFNVLFSPL